MEHEILKRIDILAEKLEVTGEKLFSIIAEGMLYSNIAYAFVFGIAGTILLLLLYKTIKNVAQLCRLPDKEKTKNENVLTLNCIGMAVFGVLSIFAVGFFIDSLAKCVAPEYAAVKEILKVLR